MQPLYLARIKDLGRSDPVKVTCAARHHVAVLTPDFLLRLGLDPRAKVLDLKDRDRWRGCGARGRPVGQVGAPKRVSRCAPPLPPVDPLHRNSLDFAGHLGRWPRNTIRHSSRPVAQRPERGKERRQLTEGEPNAALHRGLVRHETPSPV
jgi:hypothetical protein